MSVAAPAPPPATAGPHSSRTSRRSYAVWGAAALLYLVAITGRSAFGVAVREAGERFGAGPGVLSLFVVVQLTVYTASQVPVGVLTDRFGSRRVLVGGALVLAVGQLGLAFASSVPVALVCRVLIGVGDATAYVSVMRLIPAWFEPRQAPLITQGTTMVGQLGQVITAVPFLAVLLGAGWEPAFASLAIAGVAVAALVAVVVRDEPDGAGPGGALRSGPGLAIARTVLEAEATPLRERLRTAVRDPATWVGFFCHQIGMFPAAVFLLMWGMPFLTDGNGLSDRTAGWVLVASSAAIVVFGPVAAAASRRFPNRRPELVGVVGGLLLVTWATMLLPASPRPLWQLVALSAVLGASSLSAGFGFDFIRATVPPWRLGVSSGFANMGGFSSSLVSVLLIGLVLEVRTGGTTPTPDDLRVALALQGIVWAAGMAGLAVATRRVRGRGADRRTP